ncbi:tail assembly chaperone [Gordonia Phage Schomber]|nr:tail assembly chaperone [Gordonia Phage Schomber]
MTEPAQNFRPTMVNEDDTFDPDTPDTSIHPGSGLDALRAALSENVRLDNLHIRVPRRPTLRIIVDPNIDGEQFQRWQRSAMIGKSKSIANAQFDSVKLCAVLLANTMVGLEVRGEDGEYTEVRDEHGGSLNFQNPELRKMLIGDREVPSGTVLVRKLFGNDGHMIDAAGQVMDEAGYGDSDDEEEGGTDPFGVKFLKNNKLLQNAAMVASEFKMDPVEVLNGSRFFWEVRIAAFEHVRSEKAKEANKNKMPRGKRR